MSTSLPNLPILVLPGNNEQLLAQAEQLRRFASRIEVAAELHVVGTHRDLALRNKSFNLFLART